LSFLFLTDISDGSICDPIPSNFPIWSLSYEVVYYLLYPVLALSFYKYGFKKVLILTFLISLLFSLFAVLGYSNHFANVFQLYWIWVAGAVLSECKMKAIQFNIQGIKGLIFASLAFALTLEKAFIYKDYAWAFLFLFVISLYFIPQKWDNRSGRFTGLILLFSAVLINYGFTFTEVVYHKALIKMILPLLFIAGSLISFINTDQIKSILRTLSSVFIDLGSFSYALYIFHWPLLILFVDYFNRLGFITVYSMLGFILFFLLLINSLSWLLEIKFQPVMNKWLNERYYRKLS
jgi:peptidoglycan/LPS O-acetylase OafA/YrhL